MLQSIYFENKIYGMITKQYYLHTAESEMFIDIERWFCCCEYSDAAAMLMHSCTVHKNTVCSAGTVHAVHLL